MTSISRRFSDALLGFTGGRQQPLSNQHERHSAKHNMVVSSRSSRGRPSLRSEHEHEYEPKPEPEAGPEHEHEQHSSHAGSSPLTTTTTTSSNHDATIPHPLHDDTSSSRAKRNRIASVSERESLQKRRRVGRSAGPPQVHIPNIPLRGRAVSTSLNQILNQTRTQNLPHNNTAASGHDVTLSSSTAIVSIPPPRPAPPPLVTHDSTFSNSPLNSPSYRPQYDQFKRIEEKAQKVVRKSINQDKNDDKRKLRSEHGSTRSKTELAQYFPAFDDMLSLAPSDSSQLIAKTPLVLVDDAPTFEPAPSQSDYFRAQQAPHNSQIVDLGQYVLPMSADHDPLADTTYLKAHSKAERHEKQMKNGDKERAQHEKYQLERLLEELRGPDWLKTLGISGITDSEKKRYEVKRVLFIKETKALIAKFKRWKEEEKRRKLEKQQQLLDDIDPEAAHDTDRASSSTVRHPRSRQRIADSRNRSRATSRHASHPAEQGPDSSEIDALASQQLLEEAELAGLPRKKMLALPLPILPSADIFNKPFTSFFEKRHIRDAAVTGRNRGRKTYAFGLEVPEVEEMEFELPDDILTDDAIKTSQRSRRRRMRGTDD